jgi:signal transduction histidine kinase
MKERGSFLVFFISLLALTSLVAWWAVFIERSIGQITRFKLDDLQKSITVYALTMGANPHIKPMLGPIKEDERLEIVSVKSSFTAYSAALTPLWPEQRIQARNAYLNKVYKKSASLKLMVFGESGLLVILIFISGWMLFHLFRLEKRAHRELKEFWSRATHELKTPITGIKAFLETLKQQNLPPEEYQPLLALALQQVNRQQQLAENLLIGQKLLRSEKHQHAAEISLRDFFTSYLQRSALLLGRLPITLQFPEADIRLKINTDHLTVVLDNLLDNAVKFAAKTIALEIKRNSSGKLLQITVTDDGIGFNPHYSQDIFQAYRRLNHELPHASHGTGMGLYICQQLIKKMKGSITAFSKGENQGAQFTIQLPIEMGSRNKE